MIIVRHLWVIGFAAGQFGRTAHRNRKDWRDLIESGPHFYERNDRRIQSDDPNTGGTIGSIELDDFFLNDEPMIDERDEIVDYDLSQRNLSEVDPMDPEFCCNNPTECMCKFCCVAENVTCAIDVVVAVDVCHCDNTRWIKTIEFIVHLVEELKEKVVDFRFGLTLFNEVSETVISLDNWRPEWTLAEVYKMLDEQDLTVFYGRGTTLHTGLEDAYKQFDHDLKRKALLVLFSNGVSQSKDAQVLDVAAKYPGPDVISVTADSLDKNGCSGSICPNQVLLRDLTSDILIDGSARRQFWAAKEVRHYIQNKFVCQEEKCEICDCDCAFTCDEPLPQLEKETEVCDLCPDVPCPIDLIFAIDMCHCDKQRFFNAQQFMIQAADQILPNAVANAQKVRFSVVQFNELAVTSTHFQEFNGDGNDEESLNDFKEKIKMLTVDAFYGMGTNMTTGLAHVKEVFEQESMTQDDRDRFGIPTNKTEKILIIYSNGNSIDSRSAIHQKIAELKEAGPVRVIPVSANEESADCNSPVCPDDTFLTQIKDDSIDRWLDGTKVDSAIAAIDELVASLNCSDISCENPCPREAPEKVTVDEPTEICRSQFNEHFTVAEYDEGDEMTNNEIIRPNPCPALNLAFIIDGSDSITGRPDGGQWKQIKEWVADVIKELDLDQRPGLSYVSVMQYAYETELLGQKWWPIGCDPKRRSTSSIEDALRHWRQMNTTTNTYKATYDMMESYDENYVGYLDTNPYSVLVLISDGEHRDIRSRNQAKLDELKKKFDLIQIVQTSKYFNHPEDWEKGTKRIPSLREKPNWMTEELSFLTECDNMCNSKFASIRNAPDDYPQFYPGAKYNV